MTYTHTLTHTYTHSHRTFLDERSARRRDLYLRTHNIRNRHTSMPSAAFEPATPESERPQAHVLEWRSPGTASHIMWTLQSNMSGVTKPFKVSSSPYRPSGSRPWPVPRSCRPYPWHCPSPSSWPAFSSLWHPWWRFFVLPSAQETYNCNTSVAWSSDMPLKLMPYFKKSYKSDT